MNYGWRFMTLYRRQGSRPSPRKRNAKKQNGCLKRPYKELWKEVKSKEEEERYTHFNPEFQKITRRDKKAFLNKQCKETEENNRMGKTRNLFKQIRDTKGTFHAKMGSIKDRNCTDLNSAVATGLEKVSFHSNPKERQCQRMLRLPHNCTHLTH